MTIFQFIGPGLGEQDGFHVFSALSTELPGPATTTLSPGGGAIPAGMAGDVLELPVPAGLTYTRVVLWWRAPAPLVTTLTLRVLINGVAVYTNAAIAGTDGPGVILSAAIVGAAATALNDLVRVEIDNPSDLNTPNDIFVRLDYTRA